MAYLDRKARGTIYADMAVAQVPRLLSALDREEESASYGNFDRDYWAWKWKDFPLTMLQAGIGPLILLWANEIPGNTYYQNSELLRWIDGAIEAILRRQHRNGSFDSVAPFTQDHGVTLAMVHVLCHALQYLEEDLPESTVDRVESAIAAACRFARQSEENYSFISNHRALFALAFLEAGFRLGDPELHSRSMDEVTRIVERQSADGWYPEYGGADPGYETLGLHYLTNILELTENEGLKESTERSVEFLAHTVHPDGSLGGGYTSRQTSLYFPSGVEKIARSMPLAEALAGHVAHTLPEGAVVTPKTSDIENLALLLWSYLEAARALRWNDDVQRGPLPCLSHDGIRVFPDSGLVAFGSPSYYAVLNLSRGGAGRIHDRASGQLCFEDAGYVVETDKNEQWTSIRPEGATWSVDEKGGTAESEAQFTLVRSYLPSPISFLGLRLLTLTVFRSKRIGQWIRDAIVNRLVTGSKPGPFHLRRQVTFWPDAVHIQDQISKWRGGAVSRISTPRRFLPNHMGSAKYFQKSDIFSLPRMDIETAVDEINQFGAVKRELLIAPTARDSQRDRPSGDGREVYEPQKGLKAS